MTRPCPYCRNGLIDPDPPSSRRYACPDCDGTGEIDDDPETEYDEEQEDH